MSEFKREERFIVIKRKHLSALQERAIRAHMARLEIGTVECVVVESDWPEYETVWQMIERRVSASQPVPAKPHCATCGKDVVEVLCPECGKWWADNPPVPAPDLVERAIELAIRYGGIDGDHHKMWVIDQMVRVLAGDGYEQLIREACDGEDGPETYSWDEGIAP